jgi:hypothetical protein
MLKLLVSGHQSQGCVVACSLQRMEGGKQTVGHGLETVWRGKTSTHGEDIKPQRRKSLSGSSKEKVTPENGMNGSKKKLSKRKQGV